MLRRTPEKAVTPPGSKRRGGIWKKCARCTVATKALSWRCICIVLLLQFISIAESLFILQDYSGEEQTTLAAGLYFN